MVWLKSRALPWWRRRGPAVVVLAVAAVLVGVAWSRATVKRVPPAVVRHHQIAVLPSPSPVPEPSPPGFGQPLDDSKARVKIPELGIDLPLVKGDGTNVPLYKAAIHPALSPPGDGVRSMVYAHAQAGMFGPLLDSALAGTGGVGASVEIDRPDGKVFHYVIRQFFPRWPINDTRWLEPVAREELILVTCTTYNLSDPRVVAVAEPV